MFILMNIWTVLKYFFFKKIPGKKHFYRPLKDGKINDWGEKPHGYIMYEEYLTCTKI